MPTQGHKPTFRRLSITEMFNKLLSLSKGMHQNKHLLMTFLKTVCNRSSNFPNCALKHELQT